MTVSRLKNQFMDFAFEHNEYGNREPMKIIGEERERVTHFKCLATSAERNVVWKRRLQREWDQVGEIGRNAGEYCHRRMLTKLIRPAMIVCDRNAGYNEATRTWD